MVVHRAGLTNKKSQLMLISASAFSELENLRLLAAPAEQTLRRPLRT